LRYGRNERLRRIAQEIVVEQQQEIAAMRLAHNQSLPPAAPTAPAANCSELPAAVDIQGGSATMTGTAR
jgi:hypothetical protein